MFNISIAQTSIYILYDQMRFTIHSRNQINSTQIKSNVGFRGEGKTGVPREKSLGAE